MLHTESAVLGGLPFTSADFCDFCIHGPRMSIDDLSAPSESFVARVSGSVATVDRCPGRGRALPAADSDFASVFAVPTEVGTGSADAGAATTTVPSRLLQGVLHKGRTRSRPPARPRHPLPRLALRRPRRRSRLQTASPLGSADVQQQQLAIHSLLSTMALGPSAPSTICQAC